MSSQRILDAAARILAGDESRDVAEELESAVLESRLDDPRFEDLLEALALYAPGSGPEYFEPAELREVIERTLDEVGLRP